MLITPRIENRPIGHIKSKRSLGIAKPEPSKKIEAKQKASYQDRRQRRERRQISVPVKLERRRGDRRLAHLRVTPELKTMLEHSGTAQKREGRFVNETV